MLTTYTLNFPQLNLAQIKQFSTLITALLLLKRLRIQLK
jgi:hypothetical protein